MAEQIRAITLDDLEALEKQGLYRTVFNGQWLEGEEIMAGERHGAIEAMLIMLLLNHVRAHQLGRVYTGDTLFVLEREAEGEIIHSVYPDVAFVKSERVKPDQRHAAYEHAPDLAIEVISPSERAGDIRAKLHLYFRFGTEQVWQVYPETQEVVVNHLNGTTQTYNLDQTIPGGALLPGFELPVSAIFEQ